MQNATGVENQESLIILKRTKRRLVAGWLRSPTASEANSMRGSNSVKNQESLIILNAVHAQQETEGTTVLPCIKGCVNTEWPHRHPRSHINTT